MLLGAQVTLFAHLLLSFFQILQLSRFFYVQLTLDETYFSVTKQKHAISRFSAIRNNFWGQRSKFLRFSII